MSEPSGWSTSINGFWSVDSLGEASWPVTHWRARPVFPRGVQWSGASPHLETPTSSLPGELGSAPGFLWASVFVSVSCAGGRIGEHICATASSWHASRCSLVASTILRDFTNTVFFYFLPETWNIKWVISTSNCQMSGRARSQESHHTSGQGT